MEFFKLVAENLQEGQKINMTILKKGDKLVASLMADTTGVKDKAVTELPPMVISGTPEEFEEGFANAFKPLASTFSLMAEVKSYEDSVEEARKNTEMAKKAKEKLADDKKKFADSLALAKKLKDEHKFKDAKSVLEKAIKMNGADSKKVTDLLAEISRESGEGSLFGGVEDLSDGKALATESKSEDSASDNEDETEE